MEIIDKYLDRHFRRRGSDEPTGLDRTPIKAILEDFVTNAEWLEAAEEMTLLESAMEQLTDRSRFSTHFRAAADGPRARLAFAGETRERRYRQRSPSPAINATLVMVCLGFVTNSCSQVPMLVIGAKADEQLLGAKSGKPPIAAQRR